MSVLTSGTKDAYIPGILDYIHGNPEKGILSFAEKKQRGTVAREALLEYKKAKDENDTGKLSELSEKFMDRDFRDNYFRYYGYAFINAPEDIIPDVLGAFYSFHLMALLGFFFILLFSLSILFTFNGRLQKYKWFLRLLLLSIPLPYLASELGWIVTEMGRQPWIIQDLMPVSMGVTNISTGSVQTTFWLFAFLFTALLIAEISIMLKQIKAGPKH